MLKANELRVGNKFLSIFGNVETVLSIVDNTDKGRIKVCADCPDSEPHYKSENHRDMYSHLILCWENGNQYKPCEISGVKLTDESLIDLGVKGRTSLLWLPLPNLKSELHFECHSSGEIVTTIKGQFADLILDRIEFVHQLQNLHFALTNVEMVKTKK